MGNELEEFGSNKKEKFPNVIDLRIKRSFFVLETDFCWREKGNLVLPQIDDTIGDIDISKGPF